MKLCCFTPGQKWCYITEAEVPSETKAVSCAILDDIVDIHLARPYFTADAWTAMLSLNSAKTDTHVWVCGLCHQNLDEDASLVCDACFTWYHLRCCGLKQCSKRANWICSVCYITADI